jgi:hypothetical protein
MKLGILAAALIGAAALVPATSASADDANVSVARETTADSGSQVNRIAPPDPNAAPALQSVRPPSGMLSPPIGPVRSFMGTASVEPAVGGDLRDR